MPNPTTVSIRKYNKELKLSADLRVELEASRESISLVKRRNRDLRRQLKVAFVEGQELETCQENLRLEKEKNAHLDERLKELSDQDLELANCRQKLQLEKKKNSSLKQRLKVISAPGEHEIQDIRNQCLERYNAALDKTNLEHKTELKNLQARHDAHINQLMTVQDQQKRKIEQLEHKRTGIIKIPGNLEHFDEDPRVKKNMHLISGGTAGSV